jgi:hypothetical protein
MSPDASALDAPDWSVGPWEQSCRTRLVRQVEPLDCSVACLAMAAGISYDEARATFITLGLSKAPRPFASNFKDLGRALKVHGIESSLKRWVDWDALDGIGILKVSGRTRRSWHWVVAERHTEYGLVVRDPASPLVALRNAPDNVSYRSLSSLAPYGCWIRVVRPSSVRASGAGAVVGVKMGSPEAACASL